MSERRQPVAADTAPAAPRRRGRPVSLIARRAVLEAAAGLLDERGFGGFTIDEVARRSRVSKTTIYKHWDGRLDLALVAYGDALTEAVPVLDTGEPASDLHSQVRRLAAFYASDRGRVAAQLIAAGTLQPDGPALIRERFFASRRVATAALIDRAKAAGHLRKDIDTQVAIDLLFGGIIFRLFNGLDPLDDRAATMLGEAALTALRSPHNPDVHGSGPKRQ